MRRTRYKSKQKLDNSVLFNKGKLIRDLLILLSLIILVYLGIWRFPVSQLEISLAGGFIIFAFLLWKILSLYLNANEYSERKDFVDLHAKILGSFALVVSLLFTWQGIKNNQEISEKNQEMAIENQKLTLQSLENAERKQIEDRYSKALEQLGGKEKESRIGAIYSLGKIASDSIDFSKKNQGSRNFYWEIVQTLAAYIRGNSPATKKTTRLSKEMPTDIQAALNVLAWRSHSYQNGELQRLQLFETDLRGAVLKDIESPQNNSQREGSHFEGAQLYRANLQDADLRGINLKGATLTNSNFKNAYLAGADLTDADLTDADLTDADLGNAKADIDQIMSAKNWEKAKTLPQKICKEIKNRKENGDEIINSKGC